MILLMISSLFGQTRALMVTKSTSITLASKQTILIEKGTSLSVQNYNPLTGMLQVRYQALSFQIHKDRTNMDEILAEMSATTKPKSSDSVPSSVQQQDGLNGGSEQVSAMDIADVAKEMEWWKKEFQACGDAEQREVLASLIRAGMAFLKNVDTVTDVGAKKELWGSYRRTRASIFGGSPLRMMRKYISPSGIVSTSYSSPDSFEFVLDELEIQKNKPFTLMQTPGFGVNSGKNAQAFFSAEEATNFRNFLINTLGKNESTERSFKTPGFLCRFAVDEKGAEALLVSFGDERERDSNYGFQLTTFDAALLAERIQLALKDSGGRVAAVSTSVHALLPESAKPTRVEPSANIPLEFDVIRQKVTSGVKRYSFSRYNYGQQFDYRVKLRRGDGGAGSARLVLYLVHQVKGKIYLVGKGEQTVELESGRIKDVVLSAEQRVAGPPAAAVIVQCYIDGKLVKGYVSSQMVRQYAESTEVESQLESCLSELTRYRLYPDY